MSSIFGDVTIPAPGESPEGHDEPAAVETESEEEFDEQEVDSEQDQEDEDESGNQDSDADDDQQEHSEELLAGKYKSTADLVKGYKELERQFHQQRNGGGQQQPGNQTTVVPQPGQQPDFDQQFWESFRNSPRETFVSAVRYFLQNEMAPIHQERQDAELGRNFDAVSKEYKQLSTPEGMTQVVGKVREIAEEMGRPELADNPTPRLLRMAAQEAFGDTKAQAFQKGKDAARAEGERTRQSKQGLGTKGGARQQAAPEQTEEQRIKAEILGARRSGLFS